MKQSSFYSNYKIGAKIGSGSFGRIFSATNPLTGEQVAIKIESKEAKNPQLVHEYELYKILLKNNPEPEGIPRIHLCTTQSDYVNLVMELLGPSLEDKFNLCGRKFSLKTVLMLAFQMLARLEYIHSCGLIHRDIKPENFLLGVGKNQDKVYIIDFGLSRPYLKDGKHIEFIVGKKLIGTARYASINTHRGITQSRRDDLESVGYIWIYFLKGKLPWQGLKATERTQRYDKIKEKKIETSIAELCQDLPPEFAEYLTYVRNLNFEEEPDYARLQTLLRTLFNEKGFVEDFDYDWKSIKPDPVTKPADTKRIFKEVRVDGENAMLTKEETKQNNQSTKPLVQKASNVPIKNTGSNQKNNHKSKACWPLFNCFS